MAFASGLRTWTALIPRIGGGALRSDRRVRIRKPTGESDTLPLAGKRRALVAGILLLPGSLMALGAGDSMVVLLARKRSSVAPKVSQLDPSGRRWARPRWSRARHGSRGLRALEEVGPLLADAGLGFLEDPIRGGLAVRDDGGLGVAGRPGIAGESSGVLMGDCGRRRGRRTVRANPVVGLRDCPII
jgi:hypothetical protein